MMPGSTEGASSAVVMVEAPACACTQAMRRNNTRRHVEQRTDPFVRRFPPSALTGSVALSSSSSFATKAEGSVRCAVEAAD